MNAPLLQVENMRIALAGAGATHNAVEEVSFEIGRGEAFGLVGESGCGKSITALAVMGLLRRPLSLAGGRIVLDGEEIQDASAADNPRSSPVARAVSVSSTPPACPIAGTSAVST